LCPHTIVLYCRGFILQADSEGTPIPAAFLIATQTWENLVN
jgi:hypothetical protein